MKQVENGNPELVKALRRCAGQLCEVPQSEDAVLTLLSMAIASEERRTLELQLVDENGKVTLSSQVVRTVLRSRGFESADGKVVVGNFAKGNWREQLSLAGLGGLLKRAAQATRQASPKDRRLIGVFIVFLSFWIASRLWPTSPVTPPASPVAVMATPAPSAAGAERR